MKTLFWICGIMLSVSAYTQNVETDSLGFETFSYQEGDTTYVMKKYFIAFLKNGPHRNQSPEEQVEIQIGHQAHMERLAQDGIINIAGPFGDDGEIRGLVIYSVPTLQEAKRLTAMDPAVIAGRLVIELHPFWAAKGSQLK